MSKVILVQVVYNNRRFIEPVFSAIRAQTYADKQIVAVIAGNEDGGKELIAEKFPEVEIIDPGYNIGFAKGHNLVFKKYNAEYFQLVNPDLIMEPDYVEKMVAAMEANSRIGAVTGKLLKIPQESIADFTRWKGQQQNFVIDSTGVLIFKSGAARDRGQHEVDAGQYDTMRVVDAVSAAGCMYRASALKAVACKLSGGTTEIFDEDFHSYWEDVDLAWRLNNKGFMNVFVPEAVAFHGRGAGSNPGGYKKILSFIKFHKLLNSRIRQLNYKNHIWMYIKNSPWFYPQFFVREFFMFLYILLFEPGTLKFVPEMLRQIPRMWGKRRGGARF